MLDLVLELRSRGHRGKIIALSRHGLLPQRHAPVQPREIDVFACDTALDLHRLVVGQCREAISGGSDWRSVIDAMRPHNSMLWKALPITEQRRLAKKLQTYWDVHRHRVAPSIDDFIKAEITSGRLSIRHGYIQGIREASGPFIVSVKQRDGKTRQWDCDHVVNCTGPSPSWRDDPDPLVDSLVRSWDAVYDGLGWGLQVDDFHRVLNREGVAEGIYAIGPLCRGTLWETTAAPEIRQQALTIARGLVCT